MIQHFETPSSSQQSTRHKSLLLKMVARYLRSQSSSSDEDSSVDITRMAESWSVACVHDIATLCNATLDWQSLQSCLANNSAQLSPSCLTAFIHEMVKIQWQLVSKEGLEQPPSDRSSIPSLGHDGQGTQEPVDVSAGESDDINDGSKGHGTQPTAEEGQENQERGSHGNDQRRPQSTAQGHDTRGQKRGHPRRKDGSQNNSKDYELSGSTSLAGSDSSRTSHSHSTALNTDRVTNLDSHDHRSHGGGVHPLFWIFIFPFFCVGVYVSAKKALAYIKEQRIGGGSRPVESFEEYEPLQRS